MKQAGPGRRARFLTVVRLAWAGILLVRPAAPMRAIGVTPDGPLERVARVLGARHLVQGLLEWRFGPGPIGSVVDGLHATSMFALAGAKPSRRRVALADGSIATAFAVADEAVRRR